MLISSVKNVCSGEDDLCGQVEGGKQAILCGAPQLQAEPVGGAEGPLPVLPVRGHQQQDGHGSGTVHLLLSGPLVCTGGKPDLHSTKT